jgi:hypothetical protein
MFVEDSTVDLDMLREELVATLGDAVHVDGQRFSSGALSAEVRWPGTFAVIDHLPAAEWGASIDPADAEGFMGHDHVFGALADLIDFLRSLRSSG